MGNQCHQMLINNQYIQSNQAIIMPGVELLCEHVQITKNVKTQMTDIKVNLHMIICYI